MLELWLVISVLGLLSTIGYGNVVQFSERAKIASCVSNQRHLHEASILYGIEQSPGTGIVNGNKLFLAELVQARMGECPSSHDGSNDDYGLMFVANELSFVTCNVRGALHPYNP